MGDKMMVRQRAEVKDKTERLQMISILAGNGYTVREVAVKPAGKNTKIYYVEYWKE